MECINKKRAWETERPSCVSMRSCCKSYVETRAWILLWQQVLKCVLVFLSVHWFAVLYININQELILLINSKKCFLILCDLSMQFMTFFGSFDVCVLNSKRLTNGYLPCIWWDFRYHQYEKIHYCWCPMCIEAPTVVGYSVVVTQDYISFTVIIWPTLNWWAIIRKQAIFYLLLSHRCQ